MWQLYMLIAVGSGNSTFGGPYIIDGFETKAACVAHMNKVEPVVAREIEAKGFFYHGISSKVIAKSCIKVEKQTKDIQNEN